MARVQAIAEGGPLASDLNLTVDELEDGSWPESAVWTTGPAEDQRHLYALDKDRPALEPSGHPIYVFVRTLEVGEDDPSSPGD